MPAVALERLKKQIESLAWKYTQPQEFITGLNNLLDEYADHTYRAATSVSTAVRHIPSYHVPPVVMRQIELLLNGLVTENPSPALNLGNSLWKEEKEEPRLLATYLLGLVPPDKAEQVIQTIENWAFSESDRVLLQALFEQGTVNLRRHSIQEWLVKIQEWLNQNSIQAQRIGLMALLPIVQDMQFTNLPQIFGLCTPLFLSSPKELTYELSQVIITLAERTPAELAYYIRQLIGSAGSHNLLRLIRRCVPAFPEEVQQRIRPLLQRAAAQ